MSCDKVRQIVAFGVNASLSLIVASCSSKQPKKHGATFVKLCRPFFFSLDHRNLITGSTQIGVLGLKDEALGLGLPLMYICVA